MVVVRSMATLRCNEGEMDARSCGMIGLDAIDRCRSCWRRLAGKTARMTRFAVGEAEIATSSTESLTSAISRGECAEVSGDD